MSIRRLITIGTTSCRETTCFYRQRQAILEKIYRKSFDVLLVDDDTYVIKALLRLLQPYCEQIFTALSGEEAPATLDTQKIDVIVSASLTPPISGIQFLRMYKE